MPATPAQKADAQPTRQAPQTVPSRAPQQETQSRVARGRPTPSLAQFPMPEQQLPSALAFNGPPGIPLQPTRQPTTPHLSQQTSRRPTWPGAPGTPGPLTRPSTVMEHAANITFMPTPQVAHAYEWERPMPASDDDTYITQRVAEALHAVATPFTTAKVSTVNTLIILLPRAKRCKMCLWASLQWANIFGVSFS